MIGIDWADTEHVYCLMDETGATLAAGTIAHTAEGLDRFMTLVRARVQQPQEILVALETSEGPLVGALLDQRFTVYAMDLIALCAGGLRVVVGPRYGLLPYTT